MNDTLHRAGFTPGEAAVYLALFETGETTVGPLAKKAGVSHAKSYPILDKLIKKGIVTAVTKGRTKHFAAASPEMLVRWAEARIEEAKALRDDLTALLPKLEQKRKREQPRSRVLEGAAGLRSLFAELLAEHAGGEIRVFGLSHLLSRPEIVSFFRFYHDLRSQHEIRLLLLLHKDAKQVFEKRYREAGMYARNDEIRFTDASVPTGTFIIGNHVVTVVEDEEVISFDTRSETNAQSYKEFFDGIWRKAASGASA